MTPLEIGIFLHAKFNIKMKLSSKRLFDPHNVQVTRLLVAGYNLLEILLPISYTRALFCEGWEEIDPSPLPPGGTLVHNETLIFRLLSCTAVVTENAPPNKAKGDARGTRDQGVDVCLQHDHQSFFAL